jgi:hypothetical protein
MYKIGALVITVATIIISQDTVTAQSFLCLGAALVFAILAIEVRK